MPAWRAADPGPSGLGTVPGMGEQISRADLEAAAEQLWEVLGAIDAGQLTCSLAYRNRLQGAAVALQLPVLVGVGSTSRWRYTVARDTPMVSAISSMV